jgi:hypothetical protein
MAELFNSKTVKRLCKDILISPTQEKAANDWLSKLDNDELKDEKSNYPDFMRIMLQDILGYSMEDIAYEKNNVEFQYPKNGERVLCIECKGTVTKDLRALQKRVNEAHSTPINQTWSYMGTIGSIRYGICTNYKKFELIRKENGGIEKTHKFDFESIKKDKTKLQEFIGFFSKKYLIDQGLAEKCFVDSEEEQKELADEFYDLFHNTRLMLIKVFQEKQGVPKEEAIRFAQLYLNRLIFMFFAEDQGLLGEQNKNLFRDRVYSALTSSGTSTSQKVAQEIIDLFHVIDQGDQHLSIDGFNAELFKEKIPQKVFFYDSEDPILFKEIKNKYKIEPIAKLESIKKVFHGKLNPIIENTLLMANYDFETDLTVNILGHIFEQSISDLETINNEGILTRKREGVYYTPEWVTNKICMQIINQYLSNDQADQVETVDELITMYSDNIEELEKKFREIKILDMSCGSGAFLIQAVEIMLAIYKKIQEIKELEGGYSRGGQSLLDKWSDKEETKKIIEKNIYGVDINYEAIEITKLALFLKIASKSSKLMQFENLKVGNSLKFDWQSEFPEVFLDKKAKSNPGFDCIIGNPPYVRQETIVEKEHLQLLEPNSMGWKAEIPKMSDLSCYFFYHGLNTLKERGRLGFISSDSWMNFGYGKGLQKLMLAKCNIISMERTEFNVFSEADVKTVTMILQKVDKPNDQPINVIFVGGTLTNQHLNLESIKQNELKPGNWSLLFKPEIPKPRIKMIKMVDVGGIKRGKTTGCNNFFHLTQEIINQHEIAEQYRKPMLPQNLPYESGLLSNNDADKFFLDVNESKRDLTRTNEGRRVLGYIEKVGEQTERKTKIKGKYVQFQTHKLPTLASRSIWYSLNLRDPPSIFLGQVINKKIKIYENNGHFYAKDTWAEFTPNNKDHIHALLAYLRSSYFSLYLEIHGKPMGGGALKLQIYDFENSLVPDINKLSKQDVKELSQAWKNFRESFAISELDSVISKVLGFSEKEQDEIELQLDSQSQIRLKR